MTLNELMQYVDTAYPGKVIEHYWDFKKQKPRGDVNRQEDHVARFLVQEIYETYDCNLSDKENIAKVLRLLSKAEQQLLKVRQLLHETMLNLPKAHRKPKKVIPFPKSSD